MTAMPPTEADRRFRAALRARLAELGWKQKDLAERLNVPAPRVSELLNGDHSLLLSRMCEIAEAVELEPHEMLSPQLPTLAAAA